MKKQIIVAAIAALVLGSCFAPVAPSQDELESVEEMEEGAQETVDQLLEASATGDRSELDAFLAENDPTGELTQLADEALAVDPAARGAEPRDPPLAFGAMENGAPVYGNVLVFSGTGSITGLLFDLVLINAYGHAGIVDRTMVETATEYTSGTPSILSVADVLPGAMLEPGWAETFTETYPTDRTAYAFLPLDFRPVTREEPYWWSCSKLPYRVWRDLSPYPLPIELEFADVYQLSDPNAVWTIQRSSILYRIYEYWYNRLSWWLKRNARTPDEVLLEALDELVTPDELRAAFVPYPKRTWGDPTPEALLFPQP